MGYGRPPRENLVEPLELTEADRRAYVVDPIVESEPGVLEPAARVGATLVPEAAQKPPLFLGMGRDHAPFSRRHLLVRIEGEDSRWPVRAEHVPAITRSQRLACVLDEREPVPVADRAQLGELAGVAVDVDGDDGSRPLRHRSGDGRRIEVQRARIDVGEHGRRSLVDRAVRGRDERVGRRDDLVARADSGRDAEEVQTRRAARDGGCVRCSDSRGECLLEAVDRGAERQPSGPEHVEHELLFPLVEPGFREGDLPRGSHTSAGARAVSTTSSQSLQRWSLPLTTSRYVLWSSSVIGPTPIS